MTGIYWKTVICLTCWNEMVVKWAGVLKKYCSKRCKKKRSPNLIKDKWLTFLALGLISKSPKLTNLIFKTEEPKKRKKIKKIKA